MSAVFSEKFESGNFTANSWYTEGSPAIVTSPVHSISYAAMASGPNSYWSKQLSQGYNDLFFAGYVQIPSLPANGEETVFIVIADASWTYFVYGGCGTDSSGNYYYLRVGANQFTTYTTIPTNQWIFVQMEYNIDGTANLWINGTLTVTARGQTLTNNAQIVQGGNPAGYVPTGFVSYGDDYVADTVYINPSSASDAEFDNVIVDNALSVAGNVTFDAGVLIPNDAALINTQTAPIALELPTFYVPPKQAYTNLGHGNILFQDTTPLPPGIEENDRYPAGRYSSIYMVMVEDPKPGNEGQYNPILATDHGLWVEKDIQTYGVLFTTTDPGKLAQGQGGGGAVVMGHGFNGPTFPPCIVLADAPEIFGGYDTLYLYTNVDQQTLGNMTLGTLNVVETLNVANLQATNAPNPNIITTYSDIAPPEANAYNIGNNTNYFSAVWANVLLYHTTIGSFDAIDDLAVLKKIKTISDKDGKDILDPEALTHLKNEQGFYDSAKMDGWHISIQKRLLERIETLEKQLQVLAESENKHD